MAKEKGLTKMWNEQWLKHLYMHLAIVMWVVINLENTGQQMLLVEQGI